MKKLNYLFFLLVYLLIGKLFNIYIPCIFHELTGLYCPGCGITRMFLSILKLDFYQAFRYNPLVFILLPFIIFLYIDDIYKENKKETPIYKKIDNQVWIFLIIILVIYGIIRNIYPPLQPTIVN